MRMIDADAFERTIMALPDDELCEDCCYTVVNAINNAPTVATDINVLGKWVSVKDRLPKGVANKVLVYLEHDELNGYIGFGHYEKFQGIEMWYDLENNAQFAKRGYMVTHWMPLPEPPKEE